MSTSTSLQDVVTQIRSYPELTPVLGSSGYTQQPAIGIANRVLQRIFSQSLNWRWNRAYVNVNNKGFGGILTVALQQDYITSTTNIAWLEQGWRIDINNSTNNGNMAPKPIFACETIRDSAQTSYQANPFNISFIQNSLAFFGQWYANTSYGCGYGVAQVPITPIQQFVDKNGNFLYIDSTVLNLNINSPGFAQAPIVLPTPNPYGISGSVEPFAPANSVAGTQVTDGTVTWTVADPNGYAMRLTPLAAYSGLAWLVIPVYQKKPTILRKLTDTIPVPDEFVYLFVEGFLAACRDHANSSKYGQAYANWQEDLMTYLRSGDRERDEVSFVPSDGLSGGGMSRIGLPIGAANPYSLNLW